MRATRGVSVLGLVWCLVGPGLLAQAAPASRARAPRVATARPVAPSRGSSRAVARWARDRDGDAPGALGAHRLETYASERRTG